MKRLALVAALLSVPATAQADTITLTPRQGVVEVIYREGQPELWSDKALGQVSILPVRSALPDRDRIEFQMAILNETGESITVLPAAITVSDDQGNAVKVFTADELMLVADRSARNRRYWTRFGAAMTGMGGGTQTTTGNYSGTASNGFGAPVRMTGSYAEQTYNPAAAALAGQAARNQLNAGLDAAEQQRRMDHERSQVLGFRPATIEPGQQYFTGITLDRLDRRARSFTVSVSVAGETHSFVMDVARTR